MYLESKASALVGVQALAWFCQTKVWTPFSEYSLSDKFFGWSRLALAWFCQTKVWTPYTILSIITDH